MTSQGRNRRANNWECWAFGLLTLLLMLPGLNRGLSLDEYKTRMVAELPWPKLMEDRLASGHLPTYFALIKWWSALAGESAVAMRLPGVLLTALACPFLYLLGLRMGGRNLARWAALLFAINQGVTWVGQTARPYGGILLGEMLLFWAAAEYWASGRSRWLVPVFGSVLLGIAFMPLAGLCAVALLVGCLFALRTNRQRALALGGTLLAALTIGFLPSLVLAEKQTKLSAGGESAGIEWLSPAKLFEALANMVYGDYDLWGPGGLQYLAGAVLLGVFILGWKWRRKGGAAEQPAVSPVWLLCWIFVPLVALYAASIITGESLVSQMRYRVPALGGVLLLLAVGLVALRRSVRPAGAYYAAVAVVLLPMVVTTAAWWRMPGEGVAAVVQETIRQNGGVPRQIAGHERWFRMELPKGEVPQRELLLERATTERNDTFIDQTRATGHEVEVVSYNKDSKDIEPVRQALQTWAQGQPFWLFVYIQRKDGLDLLAKNPPPGYRCVKKISSGFARSYLYEPVK